MSEHSGGIVTAAHPRAALFTPDGEQITDWIAFDPGDPSGVVLVVPAGADRVRYGLVGAASPERYDYLSAVLPTVSEGEQVRVRLDGPAGAVEA